MSGEFLEKGRLQGCDGHYMFEGDYIYANDCIFSLQDTTKPIRAKSVEDTRIIGAFTNSKVQGDHIYTLQGDPMEAYKATLEIRQIDPQQGYTLLGQLAGEFHTAFAIHDQYLYALGQKSLQVIDVSNPLSLTVSTTITHTETLHTLAIEGTQLYLTASNKKLFVYDISNPLQPQLMAQHTLPFKQNLPQYTQVLVRDQYLFIKYGDVFKVFDLRDVSELKEVREFGSLHYAGPFYLSEDWLFVKSWQYSKILVFDISDPAMTGLTATFDNATNTDYQFLSRFGSEADYPTLFAKDDIFYSFSTPFIEVFRLE